MTDYLLIIVGTVWVNNFVLSHFLGLCPFMGVSRRLETAMGMGLATTFVLTLSSISSYLVNAYLLEPLSLEYLRTISFILVIATVVGFTEMVIRKTSPVLHNILGIYLPLITTNCAVLGVAIINISSNYNLVESAVSGAAGGLGWGLAIMLFAAIRERQRLAPVSQAMQGFPIALVTTGLLAMAFLGFSGFDVARFIGL